MRAPKLEITINLYMVKTLICLNFLLQKCYLWTRKLLNSQTQIFKTKLHPAAATNRVEQKGMVDRDFSNISAQKAEQFRRYAFDSISQVLFTVDFHTTILKWSVTNRIWSRIMRLCGMFVFLESLSENANANSSTDPVITPLLILGQRSRVRAAFGADGGFSKCGPWREMDLIYLMVWINVWDCPRSSRDHGKVGWHGICFRIRSVLIKMISRGQSNCCNSCIFFTLTCRYSVLSLKYLRTEIRTKVYVH